MFLLKKIKNMFVWMLLIVESITVVLGSDCSSEILFVEIGKKVLRLKESEVKGNSKDAYNWHSKIINQVSQIDEKLNPNRSKRNPHNSKEWSGREYNIAHYAIMASYTIKHNIETCWQNKDENITFLSAGFLDPQNKERVKNVVGNNYMVMSKFYHTQVPYFEQEFKKYFIGLFDFKPCVDSKNLDRKKKEGVELYKDIQGRGLVSSTDFEIEKFMDHLFLEVGFDGGSNERARALISEAAWGVYPDPQSDYYKGDGEKLGLIPFDKISAAWSMREQNTKNQLGNKSGGQDKFEISLSHKTADVLFENFAHYFYHSEQIIMQYLIYDISMWGIPAYDNVVSSLWVALKNLKVTPKEEMRREVVEVSLPYIWKIKDQIKERDIKRMPLKEAWIYIIEDNIYFARNKEATSLLLNSFGEDGENLKSAVNQKKHKSTKDLISKYDTVFKRFDYKKILINKKYVGRAEDYVQALTEIDEYSEIQNNPAVDVLQRKAANLLEYIEDLVWIDQQDPSSGQEPQNIESEISQVKSTYDQYLNQKKQNYYWKELLPTKPIKEIEKMSLELEICSHRIICPVCATSFYCDLNRKEGSSLKKVIAEAVGASIIAEKVEKISGFFKFVLKYGEKIMQNYKFDVDYMEKVTCLKLLFKNIIAETENDLQLIKNLFTSAEMSVLISSVREK